MMRNILFRGKSIDFNMWVAGDLSIVEGRPYILVLKRIIDGGLKSMAIEVVPDTVGEWTGLFDKNGKKIFEGDIVRTKFGRLCVVEWFSTRAYCGWDLKPVDTLHNICHTEPPTEYDLWEDENLEVVGNIHDNPEFA